MYMTKCSTRYTHVYIEGAPYYKMGNTNKNGLVWDLIIALGLYVSIVIWVKSLLHGQKLARKIEQICQYTWPYGIVT